MDELLYKTLLLYFKTLSAVGYKGYNTVYKILVIQFIHELLNSEFKYYTTEKDIKLMQDLLYQFIGSTCEISFPTNCLCACTPSPAPTPVENPKIDSFTLIPTTTNYVGNQQVVFTGAEYRIEKGTHIKENSLKIYWGTEVIADNLSVEGTSTTFNPSITKNLTVGQSYTAKASVQDDTGKEYFSNNFIITCTQEVVDNPSITNFKLKPSTTIYTGTQDVTFTGATFNIHKGNKLKEDSLEIEFNGTIIGTGLSTAGSTVDFTEGVTKHLVQGTTYKAKASIEDTDGNKYYSNEFSVTISVPVEPTWMYTGNNIAKPVEEEILSGSNKYDYKVTKQFETPEMNLKTIWICLPSEVTLKSVENVNMSGDFLYNDADSTNLMTIENTTVGGKSYKLYYLTSVVATLNPYKVIVQ